MRKFRDLSGLTFGKLKVTGDTELFGYFCQGGEHLRHRRVWYCRCSCGITKYVLADDLIQGKVQSCGTCCNLPTETPSHGSSKHPTFSSWASMIKRCNDPRDPYYGGAGVKVCAKWYSFAAFVEDMGIRPEGTSLDRIDPTGDYTPSNCRWATGEQQASNKTTTRWVVYKGDRMSLTQYAKLVGIPRRTLHDRILRRGETPEQAAATDQRGRTRK